MKTLSIVVCALVIGFVTGCYYDNEATLYPPVSNPIDTTHSTCDTSNVTYATTIGPLIAQRCLPACHSAATNAASGGNVNLDGYSNVRLYAANGRLLGAVTHTPNFYAMPNDNTTLTSCQIAYFRTWIRSGYQNN